MYTLQPRKRIKQLQQIIMDQSARIALLNESLALARKENEELKEFFSDIKWAEEDKIAEISVKSDVLDNDIS